jgi:hypothetical protein
MTDLEALRATIEEKRQHLQDVKTERQAVQSGVESFGAERQLKAELARLDSEIVIEENLRDDQIAVIVAMQQAVLDEEEAAKAAEKERVEAEQAAAKAEKERLAAEKEAEKEAARVAKEAEKAAAEKAAAEAAAAAENK